jgi:hypothetical protein
MKLQESPARIPAAPASDSSAAAETGVAGAAASSRYRKGSYLMTLRNTTRFRMAWLHYKHPEWKLPQIVRDMTSWYAPEIPSDIISEMKTFIKTEWKKKSFLSIDAASFDQLFGKDVHA